jgi:N-acetylmuramoyl-L-alanine amidase
VALTLFHKLQEKGIYAFFVNQNEEEISLKERVNRAKKQKATLFISIHHDSVKERYLSKWEHKGKKRYFCDKFSGYSIFVSPKNKYFNQSLKVAKSIGTQLRKRNFHPTLHHAEPIKGEYKKLYDKYLGVYRYDNLAVLKHAQLPAVLIEGGVILNREEEKSINTPKRKDSFTQAIVDGILTEEGFVKKEDEIIESW